MGILNVTPDSFYDGGRHLESPLSQFETLVAEGADIIDIGAESSRPGSERISAEEELSRLRPVFKYLKSQIANRKSQISIDTTKSVVAREALWSGATIVNDISALRADPEGMTLLLGEFPNSRVVLMHMQGYPKEMQNNPRYKDVVSDISSFFEERLRYLDHHEINRNRVILDPGIGFGKTLEHNLTILKNLNVFKNAFGLPILIGASRKSMIGTILDGLPPENRLEGSLAVALWCAGERVDYLRVHDVAATRRALTVWSALAKDKEEAEMQNGHF